MGRYVEWTASNAVGAAGGILIFWGSRVLQLFDVEEGLFSLSCKFKNCEDNSTWGEQDLLWEEIGAIRGHWNELWVLGGDFNIT